MYGIDISGYQKYMDLKAFDFDFAIVKSTEGIGFTSASLTTFTNELKELNKLIGYYHFARPDLNVDLKGMEGEAHYFIDTIKNLNMVGNAILVLDWEVEPFDRPDLVRAWLEIVQNETGSIPFIYGSKSKLNTPYFQEICKDYPVWLAQYPHITKNLWNDRQRYVTANILKTDPIYFTIWQYSCTGSVPGFYGNVDLNFTSLSKEEWLNLAKGELDGKEKISVDMQWAIDNGLIVGYGDGSYGPKDNLTREQLASVLHRYDTMLNNTLFPPNK